MKKFQSYYLGELNKTSANLVTNYSFNIPAEDISNYWISYGNPIIDYKPIRIVSIDGKTIRCVFKDRKDVFVTVKEPDIFDENVGVALAVCTKMFGSKTKFFNYVAEIIESPVRAEKKLKKKVKKA